MAALSYDGRFRGILAKADVVRLAVQLRRLASLVLDWFPTVITEIQRLTPWTITMSCSYWKTSPLCSHT